MSEILDLMINAAKKGGEKALQYFETNIEVEYKGDNSPVTIADKETEKVIRDVILSKMPNAKFVGEEGGGSLDQDEYFIIDPIDGTKSYIRGLPYWRVLIGYIKNGKAVAGVSFDPLSKNIFYGEIGSGAYFNDKKCQVSDLTDISKSFLFYTNPKYFEKLDGLMDLLDKVNTGRSYELGYEYLALGKCDIVIDTAGKAWDVAPYKPIIEEAGGKVTNLKGKDWTLNDSECLITNGLLHASVVKILNK